MNLWSKHKILFAPLLLFAPVIATTGGTFVKASDISPQSIAAAVDNERVRRNIQPLNYDSRLETAARYKSADMVTRKYFSHKDPDGQYIWSQVITAGYDPYVILGENLAINFTDTGELVAAWMSSPKHRDNILNAHFADQGLGIAFGNKNAGQPGSAIVNTFGTQPGSKALKSAYPPDYDQSINSSDANGQGRISNPSETSGQDFKISSNAAKIQAEQYSARSAFNLRDFIKQVAIILTALFLIFIVFDIYHHHKNNKKGGAEN